MASSSLQDPHDIHGELCKALTKTRGGKGVGEAAKRILKNDAKGTQLFGVTQDGRVVTYSRSSWTVKAAALDADGRHDQSESEVIATIKTYIGLEQWIRKQPSGF